MQQVMSQTQYTDKQLLPQVKAAPLLSKPNDISLIQNNLALSVIQKSHSS